MSDAADAINSRQQWVDSDTAALDNVRKRVCSSCVRPPFIKLGSWGAGVSLHRCPLCGASVCMGAIVVDPTIARKPEPLRKRSRTKAGVERERLRRR